MPCVLAEADQAAVDKITGRASNNTQDGRSLSVPLVSLSLRKGFAAMSTQPIAPALPASGSAETTVPSAMIKAAGVIHSTAPIGEIAEKRVDEIEMIGEEEAAGLRAPGQSEISAGMRFLHSSRTIHQLVTDRNRAVGVYLAVASLLWTASGAILNARPGVRLMVPIETIQYWCLPATFGTLTVLALFAAFLLIRTRIGLIYEVAKMNVLLGLPVGRVQRVNLLSIFFIQHFLISLAGGISGMLFAYQLLSAATNSGQGLLLPSALLGGAITLVLVLLYIVTVRVTTSDRRLSSVSK